MDLGSIIDSLLGQIAFFHLEAGSYVMVIVALVFLYLAIKKGFEPLLLVPIAFGMLLINICPDTTYSPEQTSNGAGGLLWYLFQLDRWSILPSLIFLDVGAITDFGPFVTNPISFLMSATAQPGIYFTYFFAILLGFSGKESAAIFIIDSADGPTSLFPCNKLGQTQIMGPIAAATYSYMALVPTIQPPFMKFLTTGKERRIKIGQFRPVSKLGKILFPIIITIVVCLILPSTALLMGALMLGNLFRENDVVKQLTDTTSNALMHIMVILPGTSVGVTTSAGVFLNAITVEITTLGLTTFVFGTINSILLGRLLRKITEGKISPLTGSAGVFAAPMVTHVSQKVGAEAGLTSFLLMHAMKSNVTGVIDTIVAAGILMTIFRV